jgi:hypothetical protein
MRAMRVRASPMIERPNPQIRRTLLHRQLNEKTRALDRRTEGESLRNAG